MPDAAQQWLHTGGTQGNRQRPWLWPRRAVLTVLLAAAWAIGGSRAIAQQADQPATVEIAYLTQVVERAPPLSLLDTIPADEGLLGARLGIDDNNTTGSFTQQKFVLSETVVPQGEDVAAAFRKLAAAGHKVFVADLPRAALLAIADLPEAKGAVIFNVQARDDALRGAECRPNVLHVIPNRAMLTDALAQYLAWKQWRRWYLIAGTNETDKLYAEAIKRSAQKFGIKIVEERSYDGGSTARRTDTGHALIQKQMPVLTQGADYDVLVVADESDLFGEYLPYRSFRPRPVAGTQGMVPTAWHRTHEQWGGTQLQNRFEKLGKRPMTERDYAGWLAVRSVGEAATRTMKTDAASLDGFIRGGDFGVAGFKGQKLSFRAWDGQLRQPILLAAARTLVSVSPQEGFLHQRSELDTLGFDQPESKCRLKR
ncbi:ABC transporter substrate-binding protein [Reyranella sp. CPCC 100927]|uniref:ABC transporter substrate-binding protein n=1 Tax=Reyranella sp. CPCC 100927 TaxID=2599616 RepID=UPI0011B7E4E0|nr:ABC transporter substrate-binding protein [Reyranella sp. CPCC 100927]TWT10677.1 ABC transporter substrate-binding protein [Reyranella sp. CPCC 100927]